MFSREIVLKEKFTEKMSIAALIEAAEYLDRRERGMCSCFYYFTRIKKKHTTYTAFSIVFGVFNKEKHGFHAFIKSAVCLIFIG